MGSGITGKIIATLLLIGMVGVSPRVSAADSGKEISIGILPEVNVFEQKKKYEGLTRYLSKKINRRINIKIIPHYGDVIDTFQDMRLDGAFFGSLTAVLAHEKLAVEPLVRQVNRDGTSTYHGHLFIRKDSGTKNILDMRGKKMVFVDKATTAGYLFPVAYLRERGITDMNSFFSEYYFAGSHDAAIFAVLEERADIGAAKNTVYDKLCTVNSRVDRELHILAESTPVPSNSLCIRTSMEEDIKDKLRKALLGMDGEEEGKAVLEKFGALRFIRAAHSDYEPVYDLLQRAAIDIMNYDYKNRR